jgi:HK97 family phage major capsid protein
VTLVDMQTTVGRCLDQARSLMEQASAEGRDLTPEENDIIDASLARAEELDGRAKALERYEDQAARLAGFDKLPRPRTLQGIPATTPSQWPAPGQGRGKTMRELFGEPARDRWSDEPGGFLRAVSLGLFDPRLEPFRVEAAMSEGSGPGGGYSVPQELAFALLDGALHQEIVRPRADVVGMTSATKMVAAYDGLDQDPTASLYGFSFQWLSENQTVAPGGGQMRGIMLQAKLGGIYLSASNELVADSPEFEANLNERLMVAIAHNLDYYFLLGSGAGMPLGALNAGCLVTQAVESGQSAEILVENVCKMFSRSSSPTTSVWVASPTTLPSLMSLTLGIPGQSTAALTVNADGTMSLLTRPLLLSSKLPVVGQAKCLSFCDFSYYTIGLRKEVGLERSGHAGFTSNSTVFRALVRVDGQPKANSPYTGEDGTTYSPFVTLAAV